MATFVILPQKGGGRFTESEATVNRVGVGIRVDLNAIALARGARLRDFLMFGALYGFA